MESNWPDSFQFTVVNIKRVYTRVPALLREGLTHLGHGLADRSRYLQRILPLMGRSGVEQREEGCGNGNGRGADFDARNHGF